MSNRLAASRSPYLLQHKDNPVDWREWSATALADARRRDMPIFLSVGYSACHWCHVMAHESFEDAGVAAVLNNHFVAIKVDREERPDIDAVYMEATAALTGRGGWPMTCLLTPAGEPFFAGTYLPRSQLIRLLESAAAAWRDRRDGVAARGRRITRTIAQAALLPAGGSPLTAEDLSAARDGLARDFDSASGGFGGAPKFPPSMVLEFLLRHYERTRSRDSLAMAARTLEAMARGGIYDQLAGGFARYSVDAAWAVPHFEKMLYDNAQLLRVYLHWWRLTGAPLAERIARETAGFLVRDLGTAEGGFAAALDADAAGQEGSAYVWTLRQLRCVLGEASGARAAGWFAVTAEGTFERGSSTLQLPRDPADTAEFSTIREILLDARRGRPQPGRDGKVIAGWNGLAIAALAEAGMLLDQPRYITAAASAAELITGVHLTGGRLRRTSTDGSAGPALAVAEDYGDLAEGLLALHQATCEPRWLAAARELLDFALDHFRGEDGTLYDTADDAEELILRPRDQADNAHPCGTTALISALVACSALTGCAGYRTAAEQALAAAAPATRGDPRLFGWGLAAAEGLLSGPVQIAIAGASPGLLKAAWMTRPPGAVIVAGPPDADGIPLLRDRRLLGGRPAAYVCRGFACDLPVTTVAGLQARLSDQPAAPAAAAQSAGASSR